MIEFRYTSGEPDPTARRCQDCLYCQAAITIRCVNADALARRGTNLCSTTDCPQWEPMLPYEKPPWWKRMLHDELLSDIIQVEL